MNKSPYDRCDGLTLHTDFYQLTMSAIYHSHGFQGTATFSLFAHDLPATRNFLVVCGQEHALDILENFSFRQEDIAYLAGLKRFENGFLERLKSLRFSGDVWAAPEGSVCAAGAPLLEITAPIVEAQLVETILMNTINLNSTLASKAARCRLAAQGRDLLEFGLRRTQGLDAGLAAARSAAIVGFLGTSNVAAAKAFDIIPVGTMAHSYITAFASESDAFEAFAATFPQSTILLTDTYENTTGLRRAIAVGHQLKARGFTLGGVRIDSGDLAQEGQLARQMLNEAGLTDAKVVVSGNLEEMSILEILRRTGNIDVFAIGTRMSCSSDAPALDLAYKLANYDRRPTLKLSTGKETLPNPKQVWRQYDSQGQIKADVVGLREEKHPGRPLLHKVMENGRRIAPRGGWREAKKVFENDLLTLPAPCLALDAIHRWPLRLTPALSSLHKQARRDALAG
ncbi:MAG: nicotinate phosphoribosyltransferase [Desulfarculales bacterium]|jgi:nicotinate phosphoribosyltransferase|nr:nicotinate phosphoribosyltransferase [Desulfarculales bacterium]